MHQMAQGVQGPYHHHTVCTPQRGTFSHSSCIQECVFQNSEPTRRKDRREIQPMFLSQTDGRKTANRSVAVSHPLVARPSTALDHTQSYLILAQLPAAHPVEPNVLTSKLSDTQTRPCRLPSSWFPRGHTSAVHGAVCGKPCHHSPGPRKTLPSPERFLRVSATQHITTSPERFLCASAYTRHMSWSVPQRKPREAGPSK